MYGQYVFEIKPGEGLGPFKLFNTMYQTMKDLKLNDLDSEIKFISSSGCSIDVIQLLKFGINLIFDSGLQKLVMIEINLSKKFNQSRYSFKNEIINKFEFKTIYNRIFGPTYPGYLDNKVQKTDYYLSYDGICFKFENIKEEIKIINEFIDDEELIKQLNTSNIETNCNSILIFKNNRLSWPDSSIFFDKILLIKDPVKKLDEYYKLEPKLIPLKSIEFSDQQRKQPLNKLLTKFTNNLILINYGSVNINSHSIHLFFQEHILNKKSFRITVGETTMQDIIENLGTPTDYILKRKDQNSELSNSIIKSKHFEEKLIKLHNYFHLGLDISYELNENSNNGCNIVSSVIVHNNSIESIDFMKYERLNVTFKNTEICSSNMKWSNIKSMLYGTGFKTKPIFLNRKEYEINCDFNSENEFEVVDFENDDENYERNYNDINNDENVKDENEGSIETEDTRKTGNVIDENNDLNNWGLSKLYGNDFCIFEVLIDSDILSCFTLI